MLGQVVANRVGRPVGRAVVEDHDFVVDGLARRTLESASTTSEA